jgi:hypothetical protein
MNKNLPPVVMLEGRKTFFAFFLIVFFSLQAVAQTVHGNGGERGYCSIGTDKTNTKTWWDKP